MLYIKSAKYALISGIHGTWIQPISATVFLIITPSKYGGYTMHVLIAI